MAGSKSNPSYLLSGYIFIVFMNKVKQTNPIMRNAQPYIIATIPEKLK